MPSDLFENATVTTVREPAMTYARMYGGSIRRVRSPYIASDETQRLRELKNMWYSMDVEERQDHDELKDEIVEALYDVLDKGEMF